MAILELVITKAGRDSRASKFVVVQGYVYAGDTGVGGEFSFILIPIRFQYEFSETVQC